MPEPHSFGNPDFLEDLKFINNRLSTADSRSRPDFPEASDPDRLADVSWLGAEEKSRLTRELEEVCVATGATGAAIALVRGEKIVCCATAGTQAPEVGLCLDPHTGLSGSCFQSRQLQMCHDTQIDTRVDPEACQRLGVRSIVVLPLMDGEELFGIVEILSSQANAFGVRDLETLKALTDRIVQNQMVQSRKQNSTDTSASAPQTEAPSFVSAAEEVVPFRKSDSAGLDPDVAPGSHISRRNDFRNVALGTLVIASAILLGTLMGWRMGWQKASLGFRAISMPYRVNDKNARTLPPEKLQLTSAATDECGTEPPPQPQIGGLMVCEGGQVIFRLSSSPPSPARSLPGKKAAPVSR